MARYTKPELREQIKEEIKASDKGGRKGQWSARKSQLLTQEYKRRGGGFLGEKDERQKSLQRWGNENWQTKEGDTRARRGGTTSRYLPKRAWDELSDSQMRATDTKKREASRSGRQYVANTGPAKRARKDATSPAKRARKDATSPAKQARRDVTGPAKRARRDSAGPAKQPRKAARTGGRMSEMPVAEAAKLVRGLDTRQLRAALRTERDGKGRKTLIQRLEAELGRR
ncbi:hypothetical protein F4558_002534 [Micromonospora profundi]|uniref:DUF5872 domain-containing protein n=1 Tax=Micromonospora profundi TaxID=1420889 RepID=UPI0016A191AC|nr:DUF5872 domain-containing protein [Micromonospora profundi]NJC12708.1 hypothetical protein [Micromonospora profundi]